MVTLNDETVHKVVLPTIIRFGVVIVLIFVVTILNPVVIILNVVLFILTFAVRNRVNQKRPNDSEILMT